MSQTRKGGLGRGLASSFQRVRTPAHGLGNAAADVIIGADRNSKDKPDPLHEAHASRVTRRSNRDRHGPPDRPRRYAAETISSPARCGVSRDRTGPNRGESEAAETRLRRGIACRTGSFDTRIRLMQPIVVRLASGSMAVETQNISWSWASVGGVRARKPAWRRSPRSSERPQTTRCCAMRCSRTSIGCSSIRSKKPRRISNCSRSSTSRTRNSPRSDVLVRL